MGRTILSPKRKIEIKKEYLGKIISIHLANHLNHDYKKADVGIIREILNNGNVEYAIKNGYDLENKYKIEGKTITSNIKEMNPYTNIHTLIEQFMAEIS